MTDLVVAREDDFDFGSHEYADLWAGSGATLFQHPSWLAEVHRCLVPAAGARPLVVTVRDRQEGRLVALVPLVRRRRRGLRFVEYAGLGVSDYSAAVVERRAAERLVSDPDVVRAVCAALGRYDVLHVTGIRDDDRCLATLLGARRLRRLPYDTHPISLPPATEDWRTKLLDPSFARHLARKRKRLRPKGELALTVVTDPDEVREVMTRIRAFRDARFAGRRAVDLTQDPGCFGFYTSVAERGALEGGPARLFALTLDGTPVAATLDLVGEREHLFLVVGYDFARLRNYSLGLLIVEQLVDRAVAAGLDTFDLTVGDEGYKSDFGAASVPMHEVLAAGSFRGRVACAGLRLTSRGRGVARAAVARWRRHRQN